MTENINAQPNIVEMAKKMRGVKILKKIKSGEAPTKSEIKDLADLQQPDLPPGTVKTQEEIRKAFSVSLRSVQHWVRDGMPVQADGTYKIADIQAWRFTREQKRKERSKSGGDLDEKIKGIKYKRDLIELKKEQGELISREDIEIELIQICIAMKRKFLSLRKSLVSVLYGQEKKEISIILGREFNNVIQEFETGQIFEKISYEDGRKERKTNSKDQHTLHLE
jgi:hypothetical protein